MLQKCNFCLILKGTKNTVYERKSKEKIYFVLLLSFLAMIVLFVLIFVFSISSKSLKEKKEFKTKRILQKYANSQIG